MRGKRTDIDKLQVRVDTQSMAMPFTKKNYVGGRKKEKRTMIKNKQIIPMKATDIMKTNKELVDN